MNEILLCPEEELASIITLLEDDERRGLEALDANILEYASDPRLYFLRGSLLASQKDYESAITEIAKAVEMAPDYAIARFQLGFLHLTSGDAVTAEEIWQPLLSLDGSNPLRSFTEGLYCLIRDEFDDALVLLERGLTLNTDNQPLNVDMALVIEGIRNRAGGQQTEEEASSATHLLLQQASIRPTRH